MPQVYIAPSQQSFNQTALGVNEQVLMNMIADALEPLMTLNGINYIRAREGMTTQQMIQEANEAGSDIYVGIRSNASEGGGNGSRTYFWANSQQGRRLAEDMVAEFKKIYYNPSQVTAVPNTTQEELRRTRMPAVNVFTAFHDNMTDARWIQSNIQAIAEAIMRAITHYFGQNYVAPCANPSGPVLGSAIIAFPEWAVVCTQTGSLNIRREPNGEVIFTLPRGTKLIVTGNPRDGFVPVRYNFWHGWASTEFICPCRVPVSPPIAPVPPTPPVTPVPPIGTNPPIMPPIGIIPPCMRPPIGIVPPLPPAPPVTPVPPIGEIPQAPCYEPRIARVRTQGSNLNMRDCPSMSCRVIAQIPNHSHILVIKQEGDWYWVYFNGYLGWSHSDYIV